MIKKLSYWVTENTNPHENIAREAYFLIHVEPEECILYLWQNKKTVVIGANQNAWKECRTEALVADGGFLARRLSGGGAVFHDLGNLNFTFVTRKDSYDVERQTEVILRAVRSFGIMAIRSGRNDLTVDGCKFSGNAYYQTGDFCYHHGTILMDADMGALSHYLQVSKAKLESKGVDSVRSRVKNLKELNPGLSVAAMRTALISAFEEVYAGKAEPFLPSRMDEEAIIKSAEHFGSWEWLYGRRLPFNREFEWRFPWGEVLIRLDVVSGVIRQAGVWTDALDVELAGTCERALTGVRFHSSQVRAALETVESSVMLKEIIDRMAKEMEDGVPV